MKFSVLGREGGSASRFADILVDLVAEGGLRNPFLVWWDIGCGRTFAMTADWTPAMADAFIEWEFYQDYATNLMLFIADLPIPPDPLLVHQVRPRLKARPLDIVDRVHKQVRCQYITSVRSSCHG